MQSKKFAINIGRQLGSGGYLIGKKLAEILQIAFYDKELITLASKESGLSKNLFEKADEKTGFRFSGGIFGLRSYLLGDVFVDNYLGNDLLFKIQSEVIQKVSSEESAVFVGRCADYILRNHPYSINIFIVADKEERIKRLVEIEKHTEKEARQLIEKTDKKRAGYYNYYTNKNWGEAKSYDLCINSSIGITESAEFIIRYIEKKFPELLGDRA